MDKCNRKASFSDWTGNREVASLGTNAGAVPLPFQDWRRIKEAFAPELVAKAIENSPVRVRRCIDPFGGSGTTGLASQFLGVHPIIAEVNPYLADLIESKLTEYPPFPTLYRALTTVIEESDLDYRPNPELHFSSAPSTFVEPGLNGRWIFCEQVAEQIVALHQAINEIEGPAHRLFRVLLGGILIELSNVVISGKGRRYRRRWWERKQPPRRVMELFHDSALRAISDIHRFSNRSVTSYEVLRGDSRSILNEIEPCQLAVFSPPYPNSADYTDVYNVELWTLGYLASPQDNTALRSATLSSHVQRGCIYSEAPAGSVTLDNVIRALNAHRSVLWDQNIPSMVGSYFSDMLDVLDSLSTIIDKGGTAWIVIGDSQYGGVRIPVSEIIKELANCRQWETVSTERLRSIRSSAQQGGEVTLAEDLIVLKNVS